MRPLHDPAHRSPLLATASCELLNVAVAPWSSSVSGLWDYSNAGVVPNLLQRWETVFELFAVGFVGCAFPLRLTAIGAALLRKLAYIGLISAHGPAVAVRNREPSHEARWSVAQSWQAEV